jgi:hypothetical protein
MQIMWFLGGFLSCAVPGLFAILRAKRIRAAVEAAKATDPWLNPPTSRAKRLLAVTREQLDITLASETSVPLPLPRGAAVLPFLTPRNGLVIFDDGVAVLPYGSEVRVAGVAEATVEALHDAYVALGHASELVVAHAASLDAQERAGHPNPLVQAAAHAGEHPLDPLLGRLAALLEVDQPSAVASAVEAD